MILNILIINPLYATKGKNVLDFAKKAAELKKKKTAPPKMPTYKENKMDNIGREVLKNTKQKIPKKATKQQIINKRESSWGSVKEAHKKAGAKSMEHNKYMAKVKQTKANNQTKTKLKRERINRRLKAQGKNPETYYVDPLTLKNTKPKDIDKLFGKATKRKTKLPK